MNDREPVRTAFGNALDSALGLVPPAAFAATVAFGLFLAGTGSAAAGSVDTARAGATVCAAYFSPLSP